MTAFAHNGWTYQDLIIPITLPLAATAETKWAEARGFRYEIVSGQFVTQVAGTGASATRTLQVKKGSTIIGSIAITLAATSDIGEESAISFAVSDGTGGRKFEDADVLTLDFPASGTAFTAGSGFVRLLTRTKPQI